MLLLRSFLQPAGFPGRLFLFVCVWQHFFMRSVSVLLLRRFGEPKGAEEMTLRELMNQIERTNSERCYGVVANEDFILVCEYGCNGADPEIVMYKHR